MDYFEQERAGLEALGYRLDENSSFMREYLEQKKKQEYLEKNSGAFDFNAYEKSVYEDFAKQKEQNDGLLRLKK